MILFSEHVTPWIRTDSCQIGHKRNHFDYSSMRWTVDEPEDLHVVRAVLHFGGCSYHGSRCSN